ncbi:hypothetical protein K435DRAFT_462850 [Dendrothele bispora CBS 962.96]|uniref:Uncharacterized protein n=1 Tax=Dendrothele bispora (strain CBS 962.96) TaxID=1314807 RepID=A0A4S8L148_DENBC|nr:hypothetical protein K435DRAFT_462850 [Dendrothele bispora CBS 962.96]
MAGPGQRRRDNDVSNVPSGLCPMRGLAPFSLLAAIGMLPGPGVQILRQVRLIDSSSSSSLSSASFILFISPSPLFLFLLFVPFCLRSSYSNNVEIYSSASPSYTLLKQNQIQESVEPGFHTKRNLFP